MIGKKITINSKEKKEYPQIFDREEKEGYIEYTIKFENQEMYKAMVEKLSTSGTYTLRIIEKY